eukprot:278829_1
MSLTVIVYLLIASILTCNSNWQCFDTKPTITYKNNVNVTVDSLPTVRIMQGWWGSQFAAQYLAYVYLADVIGVNVTFFPGPPGSIDLYLSDNLGYTYPEFYYQFIEEDKYDLLFEDWDYPEYISDGNFEHIIMGTTEVFGVSNWDNENIRQAYMNAYIHNGTYD